MNIGFLLHTAGDDPAFYIGPPAGDSPREGKRSLYRWYIYETASRINPKPIKEKIRYKVSRKERSKIKILMMVRPNKPMAKMRRLRTRRRIPTAISVME